MTKYIDENLWILISEAIPGPEAATRFVSRDDCGAVNLFLGVTRNHDKGKPVSMLFYDCYEDMAMRELRKLMQDIRDSYAVERIAVLHKIGEAPVGHTSMIVAISAAHREPAIQATLDLIDRLKRDVPIWKKETFADGEQWKEQNVTTQPPPQ